MKALIVGLGGRGRFWWAQCGKHPNVEVAGCVETKEKIRDRAIRETGIPAESIFPDFKTALDSVEADFVLDVTPPPFMSGLPISLLRRDSPCSAKSRLAMTLPRLGGWFRRGGAKEPYT